MLFRISGASQAYFGRFKGCYQCRYYCSERLYSQIYPESVRQQRKTGVFIETASETSNCTMGQHFSVDPGVLVSLYASAHHPYTTLATGE